MFRYRNNLRKREQSQNSLSLLLFIAIVLMAAALVSTSLIQQEPVAARIYYSADTPSIDQQKRETDPR